MFENVTYDYYSDTLGRAVIPSEDTFNEYALEQKAYAKTLEPFILEEREENGFDKAVCMMIEEVYKLDKNKLSDGRIETSRSIDGVSQSFDITNYKTFEQRRIKWLKLFCVISIGA